MSSEEKKEYKPAGEQPGAFGPGRGGPGRGGFGGGMAGGPVQKAKDFKGTMKRLVEYLKPYRLQFMIVFVFAILSTIFTIVGPKILGKATTKLFEGLMNKYAAFMLHKPMPSIDFTYIGTIILILIGLYVISAVFSFIMQYQMASVSQKAVFDMRRDVNAKLAKLPLKYFDARTHGEIMSRVTNDIENISTTLQQSLTQLITSVCTIVGILIMMLSINVLMTLAALAHPQWQNVPPQADVTQAVILSIDHLDPARGHLIAERLYTSRSGRAELRSFDNLKPDLQERIGFEIGAKIDGLEPRIILVVDVSNGADVVVGRRGMAAERRLLRQHLRSPDDRF